MSAIGCREQRRRIKLETVGPASVFCGFDPRPEAIASARMAAARAGVSDRVTFEVARADRFPGSGYDLILVMTTLVRPRRAEA